jgi:hypothetical protein
MNWYTPFTTYNDYLVSLQWPDRKFLSFSVKFIVASTLVLTKDLISFYKDLGKFHFDIINFIEICCLGIGIYDTAYNLYDHFIPKVIYRIPPINAIIYHPHSYIENNIPFDAIMNANDYVRGFATIALAITNANQATIQAVSRVDERIDAVENRMENIENRMENIETSLTTIIGLLNR